MTPEALHTLERVHGLVAWAATAALVAASVLKLRRGRSRPASIAATLAVLALTVASAFGLWLHPAYDAHLRQRLFVRSAELGWMFERKHHLAVVAVLLGWSALLSALAAAPLTALHPARPPLARAATVGLVASTTLALVAAIIGAVVSQTTHF